MTFQQYTTHEQSVTLKELGLPQDIEFDEHTGVNSSVWYFGLIDKKGTDQSGELRVLDSVPPVLMRLGGVGTEWLMLARALSRQEIEDEIRQDYYMLIVPFDTVKAGTRLKKIERVTVELWERSFVEEFDKDGELAVGCIFKSSIPGSDPFEAIYDALCFALEERKADTPATA